MLVLHEIQSTSVKMIQKCLRELIYADAELHLYNLEFFLKLVSLVQQHPMDGPAEHRPRGTYLSMALESQKGWHASKRNGPGHPESSACRPGCLSNRPCHL